MPNNILIRPETELHPEAEADRRLSSGVEIDATFGLAMQEKSTFVDLYESIRDLFFPPQLPPLELTSTPIAVPDRMATKANPWAIGSAAIINAGILALLIFLGVRNYINKNKPQMNLTPVDLTEYKAPKIETPSGGGGGSPDKTPAIQGKIPPRMQAVVAAPKIAQPLLPSIDVQKDIIIPDDSKMQNFGMANSPNVKVASGGNGSGAGLGSGHGGGYGPGSGGGIGGGVYRPGGGVSQAVPLNSVEAEFSDEARRAKYQGEVMVSFIVDAQGNPQSPHVVRSLGMGLDEKAIEAVMKYKFRPCRKEGKPVACYAATAVDFRLY